MQCWGGYSLQRAVALGGSYGCLTPCTGIPTKMCGGEQLLGPLPCLLWVLGLSVALVYKRSGAWTFGVQAVATQKWRKVPEELLVAACDVWPMPHGAHVNAAGADANEVYAFDFCGGGYVTCRTGCRTGFVRQLPCWQPAVRHAVAFLACLPASAPQCAHVRRA